MLALLYICDTTTSLVGVGRGVGLARQKSTMRIEATDMKTDKNQSLDLIDPLRFLLNCSEVDLDDFELSKLAAVANYRSQLHEVLDNLLDAGNQATLARLFRVKGREVIKQILNGPASDPIADAKSKLKTMGRTAEDLVPLLSLPPGQAHRTAAVTYQNRNIAEGKCCDCPNPLAHHSVRYCDTHLAVCRDRARVRATKLNKPPHGHAPGTLAALAEGRKEAKGEMNP
jgi:hypothetical protein